MIGYQLSSCCCNDFPSPRTSCCRPIYSGCVGKTYEFKFRVSVKMYCPNFPPFHLGSNIVSGKYTCKNDSTIHHDIMNNNMETFEFTIRHTIDFPTDTAGLQHYLFPSFIPGSGINLNNSFYETDGCGGANSSPCMNYSGPPAHGCISYGPAYALFRSSQDCLPVVWTNWVYPLPEDACCGVIGPFTKCTFGEGELQSNCGGCYPPEDHPWSGCYSNYILKSIEPTYVSIGPYPVFDNLGTEHIRCERTGGNSNLLHNKVPTITFIPNSSYPEQLDPNYEPKIIPMVRQFNFLCKGDHDYVPPNSDSSYLGNRYYAIAELGFGYQSKFNCGTNTDNETVIETLNLPYFIHANADPFFDATYSNGLSLFLAYTRFSLDSDPMNICIPTSSQNHILTDSIHDGAAVDISVLDIVKPEIYADEYSLRSVYYPGNFKDGRYMYNPFAASVINSWAPGSGSLGLNGPGWLDGAFGRESMFAITCPFGLYPNDELYCHYCPSITNGNIPLTINWSQFVKISETMQVTEVST